MSLYDALQKRLNKSTMGALSEAGKTDVGTQQAAIQTAGSGKALPGAAPAAPSLAEQAAASGAVDAVKTAADASSFQAQALGLAEQQEAAQTSLGQQQLDEQLRQGQQGLAAQATTQRANLASQQSQAFQRLDTQEEMKREAVTMQAEQAVANLLSNRKLSENDIFASFRQDERELEFRRDQAALEQMGTMMALRDRAYIDELDRIGRQRRLDDEQAFTKESARLALGDQLALYLDKLGWAEADLVDNLRFAEKLAQMDINQAWAMMKMATDANNAAMIASGATGLASAGAQYAFGTPSSTTPNSDSFAAKPTSTDFGVTGAGQFSTGLGYTPASTTPQKGFLEK